MLPLPPKWSPRRTPSAPAGCILGGLGGLAGGGLLPGPGYPAEHVAVGEGSAYHHHPRPLLGRPGQLALGRLPRPAAAAAAAAGLSIVFPREERRGVVDENALLEPGCG